MAFGYFATGGRAYSSSWFAMAVTFMFTPALATLAVERLFPESGARNRLGLSFRLNWWFVVGGLRPSRFGALVQRCGFGPTGREFYG